MMMTRRDWWLGLVLLAFAILMHAAVPRYEWRNLGSLPLIRIDRWTGTMLIGTFTDNRWVAREPAKPAVAAVTARPPLPPIGSEVPAFLSTDPGAVDTTKK